jgi:ubiquinone biosynthesis accessory factor UbiJ
MLSNLQTLLVPAVVERLMLLINHVLSSEPAAMTRLAPHAGRVIAIELQRWPALLPTLPALHVRITPPGLLEWCGPQERPTPDLSVQVDSSNPALLFATALAGDAPRLEIAGDAALATEVQWLVDHVRWDVEADLDRLFGPVVARQLGRLGSAFAAGLRALARGATDLAARSPFSGSSRNP